MGKNINKILGIILIVMSGIIYKMENITKKSHLHLSLQDMPSQGLE